jgi:sulfur-oxidizing protein SoxB
MEDLMTQTAITYPAVRRINMSGTQLKETLEDIADNRFSNDPYMQQGGDMVRIGGLQYSIEPNQPRNKRIQDMTLKGKPIQASKKYNIAAWAGMQEDTKAPKIWDVVADYLRDKKHIRVLDLNTPKLKNVKGNQGVDNG